MNKYIYSWLSVKNNYPSIQTLYHNTTFAENEQEAKAYIIQVIKDRLDQFNKEHPSLNRHMEDLKLVSINNLPCFPK